MATDPSAKPVDVTRWLQAWSGGDVEALGELIPMVFDDLHRMACFYFRRESPGHTLRPTALISELYVRMQGEEKTSWTNRRDFFHFAGKLMRNILVDHARQKNAQKRGGEVEKVSLEWAPDLSEELDVDIIDLNRALEDLAHIDPRQAKVVELRFFLGLTVEETAAVLEMAEITVKRDWRTAKFWLHGRLRQSDQSD